MLNLIARSGRAGLLVATLALAACGSEPEATPGVVNVYSARHYASDDLVYAAFSEQTGITVNIVEADGDLLIERVRAAGERSPADVIVTVDAGRLYRAAEAGLFQSAGIDDALSAIPGSLRHPDDLWFGFSTRARVIAYAPGRVEAGEIRGYEDLADPRFAGRICVRSSNNVYNQSLLAALIERLGPQAAEVWARGVVANMARPPQGGDTDQIRAVAAGECDLALVNHYYWVRLHESANPADQAVAGATALLFPGGNGGGTHVNVSGAGLAAGAPNPDNARAFLRFLLSEQAQRLFAEGTGEFPAVEGVAYDNPALEALAGFHPDPLPVNALGENAAQAQRIFDRVGWQ